MMTKPLKRVPALQPVSRQHHHGLLLCWKIRTGLEIGILPLRIQRYISWFYHRHLVPHFHLEETHLFPILGTNHPMVERALTEHTALRDFCKHTDPDRDGLFAFQELLAHHIRFEERELFEQIQKEATADQLALLEKIHQEDPFEENTEDMFWMEGRAD